MRWSRRVRLVVGLVGFTGLLGLSACQPPKPPAYICDGAVSAAAEPQVAAAGAPPESETLDADAAGEEAKAAVAEADTRTPDGRVPLVTVRDTPAGPEITSTPVASEAEAEAVAEQAAATGDLVAVEADSLVSADTNDTFYPQQYAFQNVAYETTWAHFGGANGTGPGAGAGQIVAVLDTGVQKSHEDLANPGTRVLAGEVFGQPAPATDDPHGHGTRVASIIAAETNNNAGMAGAAPAAQILPVKVLNNQGQGFTSNVASGVVWAADNGATVINLSLGGPNPSQALHAAVQHAVFTMGVPVISSSGNDGRCGTPSYPGAFPEVLAVGATDQANQWAIFSTTSPYVAISAPGVGVVSATLVANPNPPFNNQFYGPASGTSFAAPYVSAAAAIVRATTGQTASGVYSRLVGTATDLGPPGWDPFFGWGLLNVFAAATS